MPSGSSAKASSSRSKTSSSMDRPGTCRVAVRAHDFIANPTGGDDVYNNRAVLFLEMRWGRLVRWEDYEDTERVAAWDRQRETTSRT